VLICGDDFCFETLLSPIDIEFIDPCRVDMRHGQGSHRSDEPILGKLATRYTINNRLNSGYTVHYLRYPGTNSAQKSPQNLGRIVHNFILRVCWLRILSSRKVETLLEETTISRQPNSLRLLLLVRLTSLSSLKSLGGLGSHLLRTQLR
jgi:hypothetical protein